MNDEDKIFFICNFICLVFWCKLIKIGVLSIFIDESENRFSYDMFIKYVKYICSLWYIGKIEDRGCFDKWKC